MTALVPLTAPTRHLPVGARIILAPLLGYLVWRRAVASTRVVYESDPLMRFGVS
jgi:hypothetical protein